MAANIATRIGAGLAAGIAGAFAIDLCLLAWKSVTDGEPRDGAFGLDEEADIRSARKIALYFGVVKLSRERALVLARMLHYCLGASAGAVYAALSKDLAGSQMRKGAAFGAGLWLLGDEAAMSLSGLQDPSSRSIAGHTAALSMHLVFGIVLAALSGQKG